MQMNLHASRNIRTSLSRAISGEEEGRKGGGLEERMKGKEEGQKTEKMRKDGAGNGRRRREEE